jgi:MFS family permease
VVAGLALLTASFLLLGAAVGVVTFGLALLVLGVGKGLFAIPSRAQLSDVYGDQRGRALGVYTAGTDLGGLLASGLAIVALAVATWRAPFVPIAAALAVSAVGYVAWNRDAYAVGRTDLELRATVRRLAATRAQREVLVAFGLFYFVVGGIVNFLPTFLERTKDFDPALASGLFALVFAVGIPVKPVAGTLSDRFSRRGIAVAGLLLAAAAMGLLVAASSLLAVGAAIVLLAAGYKTQFPLADAVVMDAAPDANVGAALGAARAVFLGVGALGPAYVGVVADAASYDVAFLGLAATLLGCAALLGYRRALSVARTS